MIDGGMVIDFFEMNGVKIDWKICRVMIGFGVWVGEFCVVIEVVGLVVLIVVCFMVGIGGMMIGGGEGWFGEYGLIVDCLLVVEVVMVDG